MRIVIPSLGTNKSAYRQSGAIGGDMDYYEELEYLYSAPFVIVTNTGAESHMLPKAKNNKISTYYLMDVIAEMTGFEFTPYMELLSEYYDEVPYYNIRLDRPETEAIKRLKHMHELISYDRITGERYSVK